jgi:hypothetical protein
MKHLEWFASVSGEHFQHMNNERFFKKHKQKAPYVIVGVTCKAPLAPRDLAYVDTYLWSNYIRITTNVTCA